MKKSLHQRVAERHQWLLDVQRAQGPRFLRTIAEHWVMMERDLEEFRMFHDFALRRHDCLARAFQDDVANRRKEKK